MRLFMRGLRIASVVLASMCLPKVALADDTLAQRMQACTGCHGKQGRAGPDGYYPRIADKPAGYLYNQLLNFRDGRRHYPLMAGLLENLSDAYLQEIAQHFASLDLPYPPQPTQPPGQSNPEALVRGRALVRNGDATQKIPACVQCHGDALMGVAPAIPGLLGLPRDYLNAQLGAWQTGNRRAQSPDCMAQIARKLSAADIAAASLWLSAQPVPEPHRPAATLPAPLPLPCGDLPITAAGAVR